MNVISVTLNPSIDKTILLDKLVPGELHRISNSLLDASGKGINVSKALRKLDVKSTAMAVVAGDNGRFIEGEVAALGIRTRFLYMPGESRMNIKIMETPSGRMTEINDSGVQTDESVMDWLIDSMEHFMRETEEPLVVLSGSLPPGLPHHFYAEVIRRLRQKCTVVLDTSGEALAAGVQAGPALIKPNLAEMEMLLGYELAGPRDWISACRRVQAGGVARVILSLGGDGAIFAGAADEGVWWFKPEPVAVKSLVGCGDTMVAATIYGLLHGWAWESTGHFATAAATAAATLEGTTFPDMGYVNDFKGLISTEKLD